MAFTPAAPRRRPARSAGRARERGRRGTARRGRPAPAASRSPSPATASPAPSGAMTAIPPGVVAEVAVRAHLGADPGGGHALDRPPGEREGDGHRAVPEAGQHAPRHDDEHGVAADAAVAPDRDRRRDGSPPELLRTEPHPLPDPVPVQPPTLAWRGGRGATRRAASGPGHLDRRHRLGPFLDPGVKVDDSCGAPSSFQGSRSTTGVRPPNQPPSSIPSTGSAPMLRLRDRFHTGALRGRRKWRGTSPARRGRTPQPACVRSDPNASAGVRANTEHGRDRDVSRSRGSAPFRRPRSTSRCSRRSPSERRPDLGRHERGPEGRRRPLLGGGLPRRTRLRSWEGTRTTSTRRPSSGRF
jgi:hypothetical protein